MSNIYFISDIHLDINNSEVTKRFLNFIDKKKSDMKELYILGDLFEFWIDDKYDIEQNNIIMKRSGIIIWLYASLEIIKDRLNKTKEIRPLLGNNLRSEKVDEMFNKRQKNYTIADIKINTDLKDPKAIMEEIEGLINE